MARKVKKNDLCFCGSGKKYKNCCMKKAPRNSSTIIGSPVPLKGLAFNSKNKTFQGIGIDGRIVEPKILFSQTSYIGQTGKERITCRIQDDVIQTDADIIQSLFRKYNLLIAVDTNSKLIMGRNISVGYNINCILKEKKLDTYFADFIHEGAFIFRDCPSNISPEKITWHLIFKLINEQPMVKKLKIGLVTDHDLDNHIAYNNRLKPFLANYYIPDNVVLLYGRNKTDSNNILNILITKCDKNATKRLQQIEKDGFLIKGKSKINIDQIPIANVLV